MAHVADHLSVSALEQQYRSCTDVTAARHLQTIWLLAKGHAIAEVAATVSYAQRWVERLPKVAAWMAGELGLAAVLPQRGWEALKAINWSVQKPRPRHPASATPEEREAFKKSWSRPSLRREPSTRTRRSRSGPPMSTASG